MATALQPLTVAVCERVRSSDLSDAHRLVLEICRVARAQPADELAALALQLQTAFARIADAFADAGFDVRPAQGDELSSVLSNPATVPRLVDRFEVLVHDLFNAAHERRFSQPLAERLKAYIEANHRRPGTAAHFAQALGYSVGHVREVFRTRYGSTPAEYLRDVRLETGATLLETRPSLPIEEVARRSGFGSYQSFYHWFVERYGTAPSAYRRAKLPDRRRQ